MTDEDVLPIVQCGDPVLRRAAEPVDPADLRTTRLQRLIAQMRATMQDAPGVGLAAPQVGVPLQLAVLQDSPERWGNLSEEERAARERTELPFTVLVNPVVTPVSRVGPAGPAGEDGLAGFYEGCLSVPGLAALVARHRAVRVEALDSRGEPIDRVFTGWPARIVQHEADHLGGRLYLDRAEARSLSTADNYLRFWAGRPPAEAAAALGFTISGASLVR